MIRRDLQIEARWFHWLCGILEGEGTFARAIPSAPRRPRLALRLAERDIIARVADLVGTRVYMLKAVKDYRQYYATELVGGSAVALMQLVRPQLSLRRQAQIDQAAATYQPIRRVRHKTFQIGPGDGSEAERYWLAGYLEARGHFGRSVTARYRLTPIVEHRTLDREIAERVRLIWQRRYGAAVEIEQSKPRRTNGQAPYLNRVTGEAALALIDEIYPLLSERRRTQIDGLLGGSWRRTRRLRERPTVVYHFQAGFQGVHLFP